MTELFVDLMKAIAKAMRRGLDRLIDEKASPPKVGICLKPADIRIPEPTLAAIAPIPKSTGDKGGYYWQTGGGGRGYL